MTFLDQLSLSSDPSGREPTVVAPPIRVAFDDVMRGLGVGSPLIVVAGPAGSGKTLVLNMVERSLRDEGQSVQRLQAGDAGDTLEKASGVLLVDDAESADQALLQRLLLAREEAGPTVVLACPPSFATRFGGTAGAVFVKLSRFSRAEPKKSGAARAKGAARPDLSAPEPSDVPAVGAMGSPPLPRPIRAPGVVVAASGRLTRLDFEHAAEAVPAQRVPETPEDSRDEQPSADEKSVVANDAPSASASETRVELPSAGLVRRHREPLAALLVMAAVVVPLLLFGQPHEMKPIAARAVSESRSLIAARSKTNPLAAMEKVAAELPRPVILALLTPSPLRALPIAREQKLAARALPSAAKEERIAGKSAVVSGSGTKAAKLAKLPAQTASAVRSQPEARNAKAKAQTPRTADNSRRANAVRDKAPARPAARALEAPKTQPASSIADRSPSLQVAEGRIDGAATLLSHDQIARLLRDLSQRVGFAPAEYSALQACVFGKAGAGPVEADVFRSLVRRCVL